MSLLGNSKADQDKNLEQITEDINNNNNNMGCFMIIFLLSLLAFCIYQLNHL